MKVHHSNNVAATERESVSAGIYGGIALGAVIAFGMDPNSVQNLLLGGLAGAMAEAFLGHFI